MVAETKQILEELKTIRTEIDFIKTHMFDPDVMMTTEESKRFERSMQELKEGKTIPLAEMKKRLGL